MNQEREAFDERLVYVLNSAGYSGGEIGLILCGFRNAPRLESTIARYKAALEEIIKVTAGTHRECPVEYCVERISEEALHPTGEGKKK